MLALLISLMMASTSPSILTVPVVMAAEISPQEVWMKALASCESNGNDKAKVLDTNNLYSRGRYQYQMHTWLKYQFLGTTRQNIFDAALQDMVTKYILDTRGDADWYNCSKTVRVSLGDYPRP